MRTGSERAPAALTTALEAEHAAVFVISTLGGRASALDSEAASALIEQLTAAEEDHRDLRDRLVAMVGGADVAPPSATYAVPPRITQVPGLRRAALRIEQTSSAALLAALGTVTGPDRRYLVTALGDAAVRQLGFGGRPSTFPGT